MLKDFRFRNMKLITNNFFALSFLSLLFLVMLNSCVNDDPIVIDHEALERTRILDFVETSEKEYVLNQFGVYEWNTKPKPQKQRILSGDIVTFSYKATSSNGDLIQENQNALAQVGVNSLFPTILDTLFQHKKIGDTSSFIIPSSKAFGSNSDQFFSGLDYLNLEIVFKSKSTEKDRKNEVELKAIKDRIGKLGNKFEEVNGIFIHFPEKTILHDTVYKEYKTPLARRVEMNYSLASLNGQDLGSLYEKDKFVFELGKVEVIDGLKILYDSLIPNYTFMKPHYDSLSFHYDSLSHYYDTLTVMDLVVRATNDSLSIHYDSLSQYYDDFSTVGFSEATVIIPSGLAYGASIQVIPELFKPNLIKLGVISAIGEKVRPFEALEFQIKAMKKDTLR